MQAVVWGVAKWCFMCCCAQHPPTHHAHGQLWNHGHVQGHIRALANTQAAQVVAQTTRSIQHLLVGHHSFCAHIVAFPEERHSITLASLHVAVEAVVGQVGLCPSKPFCIYRSLVYVKVPAVCVGVCGLHTLTKHICAAIHQHTCRPACLPTVSTSGSHCVQCVPKSVWGWK